MSEIALERIKAVLEISEAVRYVAHYQGGKLTSRERAGLDNASRSDSDRYEELFVNPTALALFQQRSNLDGGGLHYVLIRYGSFLQFVPAVPGGHISVALEPSSGLIPD